MSLITGSDSAELEGTVRLDPSRKQIASGSPPAPTDELVYGVFNPPGIRCFQSVFHGLKDESGQAVILGCTEIPLVIGDQNSALPTLDSTRLLARAVLRHAVASTSGQ